MADNATLFHFRQRDISWAFQRWPLNSSADARLPPLFRAMNKPAARRLVSRRLGDALKRG